MWGSRKSHWETFKWPYELRPQKNWRDFMQMSWERHFQTEGSAGARALRLKAVLEHTVNTTRRWAHSTGFRLVTLKVSFILGARECGWHVSGRGTSMMRCCTDSRLKTTAREKVARPVTRLLGPSKTWWGDESCLGYGMAMNVLL